MKLAPFVTLILGLMFAYMEVFHSARALFNETPEYRAEIARLKADKNEAEIKVALEREHFLEFRQSVATLMPNELNKSGLGEAGYAIRNLASTVSRKESDELRGLIAKTLFERAKREYGAKDYGGAVKDFKDLVERFSYTVYVPEAYFLLSESFVNLDDTASAVLTIQHMIELFPQHELTGYAMVRLGAIYEANKHAELAADIYKTVIRTYPQREICAQAKASLRRIDL